MEKTLFQCNFCMKTFKKKIGPRTFEVSCPYCKEIDVYPVNFFGLQTRGKRDIVLKNGKLVSVSAR